MITILAVLYAAYAFVYFYSYRSGYSLLRYMYKRKNINVYLSIELIFFILTSLVVFTNQPLNWVVAILMFMHLIGIAWLVANPKNFYEIVEESIKTDGNLIENTVVGSLLISSMLVLFSGIIF
tara:strand:- start:1830 stop:2198 length:369 start_codon:yes stop_codon:yes gene_type:complete